MVSNCLKWLRKLKNGLTNRNNFQEDSFRRFVGQEVERKNVEWTNDRKD